MKYLNTAAYHRLSGRVPLVLLWLLGIPLPILLLIWIFRG